VLYITDLTANPGCTAGDQQQGGTPYDPVAIFGSWKSASEGTGSVGTPAMMDPMANHWNLGDAGADPVPSATMSGCTEGFGAELRFEVGLIAGHSYRFQVMVHDGDQNKGGDSGESCAVYCAPSAPACPEGETACGAGEPNCPEATSCVGGCCVVNEGGASGSSSSGGPPR
jgi:hypothetical protein